MIFGYQAPRMIHNTTTVDLDHAKVISEEPTTDYVENVSQIDGQRSFANRGTSWTVKILVYLFKYADPLATYQSIVAYKGLQVTLLPHRDGREFEGTSFILKEVTPFFMATTDYKDGLILEFQSASIPSSVILPGRSMIKLDPSGEIERDPSGEPILVWV